MQRCLAGSVTAFDPTGYYAPRALVMFTFIDVREL